jgi:hypothetical protein
MNKNLFVGFKGKLTSTSGVENIEKNSCMDKVSNATNSSVRSLIRNLVCKRSLLSELTIIENNETSTAVEPSKSDIIKRYLTIIGQLISIVSLFVLLVIYTIIKKLRNLAGKLLMSLSIALLLTQATFLTSILVSEESLKVKLGTLNLNLCYFLGLLSHYFHLAFFLWSNVIAFDLFKVFTIFSSRDNKSNIDRNKLLKYSLVAWLSPFIAHILLQISDNVTK